MTAIATPRVATARRIGTTLRIHAANPWAIVYTPWLILMGVFLLNFSIWHLVLRAAGDRGVNPDAFHYNGGVSWVLFYMVVVAVQAMNQTFSFVVGLGATRRDYFLGTAVLFVGLSLMYGVGIAAFAGLERATDGWGVSGWFFAPWTFATMPLWEVAVVYTLVMLFMFFGGSTVAAVFVRWGANGIILFFASVAVLIVASLYAITQLEAWDAVGQFFSGRDANQLALMSLVVTVAAGFVGYALMRRATPKG